MTLGRTGLAGKHDPLSFRSLRLREKEEGGGGTDDDTDDEMNDSSDDDADDEDDEQSESSDKTGIKRRDGKPATQKDFDALQEALRKERSKNRKTQRGKSGTDDDKGDGDDATEKARAAEREKWQPMVVRQAATSALSEAGLALPDDADDRRRALKRALRLLDLSDVEVDDDGDVNGLDDAIADLKDDMPELFTRKRSNGKINGADRRERSDSRPKSTSEIQARGLLGKDR